MVFLGDEGEAAEIKDEAFEGYVLLRVNDNSYTINGAFEQFSVDGGDGIGNPLADFGVTRLADAVIVLFCRQEGLARVDVALVEDGVNGDDQKVTKDADEGLKSDDYIRVVHVDVIVEMVMIVVKWHALGGRVLAMGACLGNLSRVAASKSSIDSCPTLIAAGYID